MNRRKYKYKVDRKLLINVTEHPKSSFNKRPTKPGMHAKKMYSKTYHGELLFNKQKLLSYYSNLKDYQLKNIIKKAICYYNYKSRIIYNLESRLDVILYRSGCVLSMRQARQIINHKKVTIIQDNKSNVTNITSYKIKSNVIIKFKKETHKLLVDIQKNNTRKIPKHIIFDSQNVLDIHVQYDLIPNTENDIEINNISIENIISYYKL
jgi:ribosomal protein S4